MYYIRFKVLKLCLLFVFQMPRWRREGRTSVRVRGSCSVWPGPSWGRAASSSWTKPRRPSTWQRSVCALRELNPWVRRGDDGGRKQVEEMKREEVEETKFSSWFSSVDMKIKAEQKSSYSIVKVEIHKRKGRKNNTLEEDKNESQSGWGGGGRGGGGRVWSGERILSAVQSLRGNCVREWQLLTLDPLLNDGSQRADVVVYINAAARPSRKQFD